MNVQDWMKENLTRSYEGKTILFTGGNSGIGLAAVKVLSSKGAKILLPVRSLYRGEKAKEEILAQTPNAEIELFEYDQSDLRSVRRFANRLIEEKRDIDAIVHNAGVYHLPKSLSNDGYEKTMATNCIGNYLLNELLQDYLLSLPHPVDVVFTTSIATDWARLKHKDFFLEKGYSPFKAYANSKLALLHYYLSYQKRAENTNLRVSLTHPGICYTPLITKAYKPGFASVASLFMRLCFHKPEKACLGILLCLEKEEGYFVPRGLIESSGFPKEGTIKEKAKRDEEKTMAMLRCLHLK